MSNQLSGLVPVLATPFQPDGSLDLGSMRRLVEFQLSSGADGVGVFGMASEAFALTDADRWQILATVREVAPHLPLVAGVAAAGTPTSLEQCRAAVDGGASALMVMPPLLGKPSADQIVDFYTEIAAATTVPVMVQDAPTTTGISMSVALLAELSAVDGIEMAKIEAPPTAPKIGAEIGASSGEFRVLGGQNALFLIEELDRGAAGTMPASEFTDALRPILDAVDHGCWSGARERFTPLLPLIRFGMQGSLAWAVHKYVLVRRGVIASDAVRAPATSLDETSRKHLDWILDDLSLPLFRA